MNCRNILVVEDNNDIRETIAELLEAEGFTVASASDGQEALDFLKTSKFPTLIFLDLMMPVMSGWELLDAIKADPKLAQHKVITISAVPATQSIDDPTPLETAGNITKPLSLEAIWAEVQKHCEPVRAAAI